MNRPALAALVAETMHQALDAVDENWHLSCMDPDGDGSCSKGHRARQMLAEDVAPAVLDALAKAGLLLLEGAETRTEHEIEWRKIGQTRGGVNEIGYVDLDAAALAREVEAAASFGSEMVSHRWRKVTTYADGSTLTGAWVEVDAVRLAEEGK